MDGRATDGRDLRGLLIPVVGLVLREAVPAEREAGLEAQVVLLIELDETGKVTFVEVMESAGEAFDAAATEALQTARFTPAMTADGPVGVAFPFTYTFALENEPASDDNTEPPADEAAAGAAIDWARLRRSLPCSAAMHRFR